MSTVIIEAKTNTGFVLSDEYEVKILSMQDKFLACIGKWLLFLSLALISLFIPVAHFILVPLFLALSFYFAYQGFKCQYELKALVCPLCKKQIFNTKKRLKNIFRFYCNDCREQILFEIKQK